MSRTPNAITRRWEYHLRAAAALNIDGRERMPADQLAAKIKAVDPLVADSLQRLIERDAYLSLVEHDERSGFVDLLKARDKLQEARRQFLATVSGS